MNQASAKTTSSVKDSVEIQKKWAEAWRSASSEMRKLKAEELSSPDYHAKNIHIIDELLEYAVSLNQTNDSSCMIEMQNQILKYIKK